MSDLIEVNGYEILKGAIKDSSFVSELKDKYGEEFVRDVIDYFDGKYDNSVIFKDIEKKIDDKLKEIINMIYVRNVRGSSTFSSVDSSSNVDSSIDRDEHMFGNSYSSELVISAIDEEIDRVSEDVKSLEDAIKEVNLKDKKLREELQRKKALLEILKGNKKELSVSNSLDEGSVKLDRGINDTEMRLKQKEAELDRLGQVRINNARTKRVVESKKARLQREVMKLKAKQGSMMAKQRKAVNKKLNSMYKRSEKEARITGNRESRQVFREERDRELESLKRTYQDDMNRFVSRSDKGIIGSQIRKANFMISYYKYNLVSKYCVLLKKKDARVDGLRQLPDRVKDAIMNSINNTYAVAGGRSR